MSSNLKMLHSSLIRCHEVEQTRPCIFFGKGFCPSCYAEQQYDVRKAITKHTHTTTAQHGLIRLGTYVEITPEMWHEFKNGRGSWDCCKQAWTRLDFPTRYYYMITRGLSDQSFYSEALADRYLVNLQVSVDILRDGRTIPNHEALSWFNKQSKVIFRFKTTSQNVFEFIRLQQKLKISHSKIMETPLSTPTQKHAYGEQTPLEKVGWKWNTFNRCNTKCSDCWKENGALLCAAKPRLLELLPSTERPPPPRHAPIKIKWKREAALCLTEHDGSTTFQEAETWFLKKYPTLEHGKPNWKWKMRVAIQRNATQTENGSWQIRQEEANKILQTQPLQTFLWVHNLER